MLQQQIHHEEDIRSHNTAHKTNSTKKNVKRNEEKKSLLPSTSNYSSAQGGIDWSAGGALCLPARKRSFTRSPTESRSIKTPMPQFSPSPLAPRSASVEHVARASWRASSACANSTAGARMTASTAMVTRLADKIHFIAGILA